MPKSKAFWTGILGVSLFVLTTIIGGFLHPDYNHISQFISELYAIDAPNADMLRFIGYIPSGILFMLFAFFAIKETPKSVFAAIGFIGFGLGYGLGTVICGFFTCDVGCNPEFINPSLSQIIHNLVGFLTYLVVPITMFMIALSARKWKNGIKFSNISLVLSFLSFCFVGLLNAELTSPYRGLIQRIIEGSILLWVAICAFYISKNHSGNASSE
nr:DUF998 domain-containing protein [uncultured Flavobacterium sp.]